MRTLLKVQHIQYAEQNPSGENKHNVLFIVGLQPGRFYEDSIARIVENPFKSGVHFEKHLNDSELEAEAEGDETYLPFSGADVKTRIITKGGEQYDLLISCEEFEEVLRATGTKTVDVPSGLPGHVAGTASKAEPFVVAVKSVTNRASRKGPAQKKAKSISSAAAAVTKPAEPRKRERVRRAIPLAKVKDILSRRNGGAPGLDRLLDRKTKASRASEARL